MKIIGKTEKGLLIDATEHEVANILGAHYWAAHYPEIPSIRPEPGMEIKVSNIYSALKSLAARETQLKKLASEIRVIADGLEVRDIVLNSIALPVKEAEKPNAD